MCLIYFYMFFQGTSMKVKYQKCLDVLMPSSFVNQKELQMLIYELLSKVDNSGKSPMSYAFKYWHKDIIYRILILVLSYHSKIWVICLLKYWKSILTNIAFHVLRMIIWYFNSTIHSFKKNSDGN